jgi:hypothetical protein
VVDQSCPAPTSGNPLGDPFTTELRWAATTSPEVPLNTPLTLREITTPGHLQPIAEQQVKLEHPNTVVPAGNVVHPGQSRS